VCEICSIGTSDSIKLMLDANMISTLEAAQQRSKRAVEPASQKDVVLEVLRCGVIALQKRQSQIAVS
jgi:hypothetical protein